MKVIRYACGRFWLDIIIICVNNGSVWCSPLLHHAWHKSTGQIGTYRLGNTTSSHIEHSGVPTVRNIMYTQESFSKYITMQ